MSDYFVPYMWGTLGILYNTDYVTEADLEKGYGLLWNEAGNPDIDSKILMKDSIRDSYVAAVMYLKEEGRLPAGYENIPVQKLINTVDEQADVLKGYEVDFGKAQMTSERAYVDLAWSGDALWAMEDADNLNYFVPESGGNVWFDGWCLLKSSQNPSAAYMFIEYLCRPDIAMRNAMAIGYTSGVSKAALMADEDAISILTENEYDVEEYFGDELRYPEISADNLGVMKDFGANNSATIEMWERVKSSKQNSMWILWVAIAAVVGGLIAFGAYYFMNNRSRQFVRLIKTREELEAEEQEISK